MVVKPSMCRQRSLRWRLRRSGRGGYLSAGAWIILSLAVASSLLLLFRPSAPANNGLTLWTSAREHSLMYGPILRDWNRTHQPTVTMHLFSADVLSQRMMSGFLSGVPVADLIEVERSIIGPVFAGPLKDVGFTDLTDRLRSDGLLEEFNEPSFSPWSSRGRIFGLPHDVHPVLLGYRKDLTDAAGIDMSRIQTWDDFARVMKPITDERGPDGRPLHYAINLWYTSMDQIEALILQAGGQLFDAAGVPRIDSDTNAHVLATVVSWTGGADRIAADAPEFDDSGNQLRLQGYVVCSIMPDWLGGVWKTDIPGLAGKIRVMPLPAWTAGGRRTSVWGGTMMGIPKTTRDFEQAWTVAKHLYLNPELARELFVSNDIISPIKQMWKLPFYQVPDPYFGGQKIGPAYIAEAPNVPVRSSSPYNQLAKLRVEDAAVALRMWAEQHNTFDRDTLEPQAKRLLGDAQGWISRQISKNTFLQTTAATHEALEPDQHLLADNNAWAAESCLGGFLLRDDRTTSDKSDEGVQ